MANTPRQATATRRETDGMRKAPQARVAQCSINGTPEARQSTANPSPANCVRGSLLARFLLQRLHLQLLEERLHGFARDRVGLGAAGARDVDADDLALEVDEGAAAVARLEDGIVLQDDGEAGA